MEKKTAYILANFGGPRNLAEIKPFLCELLTDQDVIRTKMPSWLQTLVFRRVAKKRAKLIAKDYELIGGKSPIFADTEELAAKIACQLTGPLLPFHRYLPATHPSFKEQLLCLSCDEIRIFPMFPQFTYGTTGSIARWFQTHLPKETVAKMRWVKSYASHPSFIAAHQRLIREYLQQHRLKEEESILLFSAHGVPKSFISEGDIYIDECEHSFELVKAAFPKCLSKLAYQSQFGKEVWVKPYTLDVCQEILQWHQGRKNVIFIPIAFTSDHIETLFEVEEQYMTQIRERGLDAYRVPALNQDPAWIATIIEILKGRDFCNNQMLIRS
jgi:protoporphyrin/coproporphyrin ferrochelatase